MDSYAKQTETINALELKLRNTEETLERKTQEYVEMEQTHSIFKEVSDIILLEIGMTWSIRKRDVNLKQSENFVIKFIVFFLFSFYQYLLSDQLKNTMHKTLEAGKSKQCGKIYSRI